MEPRRTFFTVLLGSPPRLHSDILRRALSGQRNIFGNAIGIRTARAYHRPRIQHIRSEIHWSGRRLQSTTTSTPTSEPTTTSQDTPLTPPRSRTYRFLVTTALSLVLLSVGFSMSVAPAAETINGYVNPPTDAETLHLYHPLTAREEEINEHILNHPLSVSLRSQSQMVESRPHMRIPPAMRPHNLTAGVLAGEGRIEVPPLNFNDKKAELPSMVQIMYFGESLCGHPGVVHGGMLATMLDEGLARACFPALPNKIGVTASLKIDYRVPCPAGSYVVLKAYTEKVEGRKAWVKGWIELLGEEDGSGKKLVEAEALFIEPRNAGNLAKNLVASD